MKCKTKWLTKLSNKCKQQNSKGEGDLNEEDDDQGIHWACTNEEDDDQGIQWPCTSIQVS